MLLWGSFMLLEAKPQISPAKCSSFTIKHSWKLVDPLLVLVEEVVHVWLGLIGLHLVRTFTSCFITYMSNLGQFHFYQEWFHRTWDLSMATLHTVTLSGSLNWLDWQLSWTVSILCADKFIGWLSISVKSVWESLQMVYKSAYSPECSFPRMLFAWW